MRSLYIPPIYCTDNKPQTSPPTMCSLLWKLWNGRKVDGWGGGRDWFQGEDSPLGTVWLGSALALSAWCSWLWKGPGTFPPPSWSLLSGFSRFLGKGRTGLVVFSHTFQALVLSNPFQLVLWTTTVFYHRGIQGDTWQAHGERDLIISNQFTLPHIVILYSACLDNFWGCNVQTGQPERRASAGSQG